MVVVVVEGEKPAVRCPQGLVGVVEFVEDDGGLRVGIEVIDDRLAAFQGVHIVFPSRRVDVDRFGRMDIRVAARRVASDELVLACKEFHVDAVFDEQFRASGRMHDARTRFSFGLGVELRCERQGGQEKGCKKGKGQERPHLLNII